MNIQRNIILKYVKRIFFSINIKLQVYVEKLHKKDAALRKFILLLIIKYCHSVVNTLGN